MSKTNIDDLLNNVDLTPDSLQEPIEDVSRETIEAEPVPPESEHQEADTTKVDNKEENVDKDKAIDEYGQKIEKKERVYTQEEHDRIMNETMRDRTAREKWVKEQYATQQQPQPTATTQENTEGGDWVQELKTVIKQTVNELTQEQQEQQWRAEAQRKQAEFEVKFNSGATKYADFEQVVVGKALTPDMVRATMGMNDPAAFIYAAAKTQANELDRISKLHDPMTQAVELGKLEERMRRTKANSSNAPRPMETPKGDAPEKVTKPKNIDDILRDEAAKVSRSRR